MVQALLLQPPPGDLTGPYPALPYLKAAAQQQGYRVEVRDLGLEAFYFLTQPGKIEALLSEVHSRRRQLEAQRFLSPQEKHYYEHLRAAAEPGFGPESLTAAVECFKDPKGFYDYQRSYKKAAGRLNAFFRLLSAVHFPTEVTAHEYTSVRSLQTLGNILAHRGRRLNPYMDYYEEVVFPQVAAAGPAVVGLSVVFGSQAVQGLVLGRLLKERLPGLHVTLGGAYLSQWLLLLDDTLLGELFKCADSFILGEGEMAFAELLDRVVQGRTLDGVPNLIFRPQGAGKIHRFEELEYPEVAELPPPDFSDLDLDAYLLPKPVIPYAISRGCYWGRCVFCQNRYGDNQMRRYQTVPVDKAVTEISELLERYHTNKVNFSNDVIDPAYLKRFSEAVLASGRKFFWNSDLRAEKAFDRDLCRLMARAGLRSVAIGLESGCPRILQAMDKGIQVETARQVMKNLYDAGVATQVMGIFGFPGETEKDGLATVRFLEDNVDRISYYVMGLLLVMPGSRMFRDPAQYGVSSISFENNPLRTPEPVWRSEQRMSIAVVQKLYERLSGLEDIYELNEYPLVGALSTNHSFLYFEKGPDILKRLKDAGKRRHGRAKAP
jgi:anaerobic magnesium-protoporphyrin IX monomethyl ester cyclase